MDDSLPDTAKHDGGCDSEEVGSEISLASDCQLTNGPDITSESPVNDGLPVLTDSPSPIVSHVLTCAIEAVDCSVKVDSTNCSNKAADTSSKLCHDSAILDIRPEKSCETLMSATVSVPIDDTGQADHLTKPSESAVGESNQVCLMCVCGGGSLNGTETLASATVFDNPPSEKVIPTNYEELSSAENDVQCNNDGDVDDSGLGSICNDTTFEAAAKNACESALETQVIDLEALVSRTESEASGLTGVTAGLSEMSSTSGLSDGVTQTVMDAASDQSDGASIAAKVSDGSQPETSDLLSKCPDHRPNSVGICPTVEDASVASDEEKPESSAVEVVLLEAAFRGECDDGNAMDNWVVSSVNCLEDESPSNVCVLETSGSCQCPKEEWDTLYDVPPEFEDEVDSAVEDSCSNFDRCAASTGESVRGDRAPTSPGEGGSQRELADSGENCPQSDANFYEEIKRDQRRCQSQGMPCSGCNSVGQEGNQLLFKQGGLVDEVLTEVERVQQRHAQVLQELNLDIENLIMPVTPSVSPLTDSGALLPQPPLPLPPSIPPHRSVVAATPTPETKSHNPCTRTLPPLPVESPQEPVSLRLVPVNRELQQTKSAPAACPVPVSSTASTPTGVKHWLSRLPSFPSFREKKPRTTYSDGGSWRWSGGDMDEPIYMLYDDSYRLHEGPRYESEDGIYEDIDKHNQRFTMPSTDGYAQLPRSNHIVDRRSLSSSENNEDNSDNESIRSSGSLSVSSLKGKLINFRRKISRQEEKGKDFKSKNLENNGKPEGKFTRLFSKRKGYDLGRIQSGTPIVEQPEENKLPQLKMSSLHQRPILPPPPSGLSPEQTKRRYIVGTLVHSENSYVASLKKLVHEYKKPLDESSPPILSASKLAIVFHRLPDILQCHTNFCISLAACIQRWDIEEKIGDVFLHAFSKTSVLDVYSDYINNFSSAMELAKLEAKRKSAFTDFLKMKQITSHDRLSFFGLMVKPVQRFPQFILLLQDLLRHSPQRHHDRMALQLALTQMETMADMLNERKRESDQAHAVKDILRHVSAKSAAKSLSEGMRYMLRQDMLTQLIFNQNGQWMKSKDRKLFLLNDLLVCVSVGPNAAENSSRKSERLSFKWSVPITEVEVQEDASPILNRMVYAMTTGQSSATKPDAPNGPDEMEGMKSIYQDLNDMLHDFEITSRISALVSTLRRSYVEISVELMQSLSQSIQQAIQKKDEEVKWIDSCCLQFSVPLKTKTGKVHRDLMIFQSKSMDTKQEWLTDVRLAQLARDANNSPAWDIPEPERRPSTKIPLFVKAVPVHSSQDPTEVKCGCYHRTMSNRILGRRLQDYVWLCSTDGVNSHISVHTLRQMGLRDVFSFDVPECRISAMESVPSVECPSSEIGLHGDTVWMGTESRRILVFSGSDAEHYQEVGCAVMSASVLHLKFHFNQVYVALANGTVAVFRRNPRGYWLIKEFQVVTLGSDPVTCLLPVNASIYCSCGRKVWVVDSSTAKVTHTHSVQHDHMGSVYTMAHSGIGLWLNLRNTAQVCLYHAETFQHLQDINITSSVRRVLGEQNRLRMPHYIYITTLTTSWGLLWIGTNAGVVLSIPLPRLQGMPILGRRANMAYHANVGPVSTILVLQPPTQPSVTQIRHENKMSAKRDGDRAVGNGVQADGYKPAVTVPLYSQHFRSSHLSSRGDSLSNLGIAKTLPRSWKSHMVHDDPEYSIYGLYDNLLNVREGAEDSVGALEEDLRHSDPDLIPSLVNSLDRRLRLNSGRPRSLDLANLPCVSDFVCVSSSSEDCGSGSQSLAELPELAFSIQAQIKECEVEELESRNVQFSREREIEPASSGVLSPSSGKELRNVSTVTLPKKGSVPNPQSIQRSVVTLVGGRGYVDLRKTVNLKEKLPSPPNSTINPGDAYAILWEMKMVRLEKNRTKK